MRDCLASGRVFLCAVIISFGFALPAAAQGPGHPPGVERAINAKNLYGARLFDLDGVVGVGVGLDSLGQPAIIVLTTGPEIRGMPLMLGGVNVEIKVSGRFAAIPKPDCSVEPRHPSCKDEPPPDEETDPDLTPTDTWPRPVPIGVSTGNAGSCSSGTIGFRLKDGNGNLFALSNNHVYALTNIAPIPSNVLQPGRFDTNCVAAAGDVIGELAGFVEIDFSGENLVDAAIAELLPNCLDPGGAAVACVGNATPADGYDTPRSTTAVAQFGDAVMKYGRTTGLTRGMVIMILTSVNVTYSAGTAHFINQIVIESPKGPLLKAGDSGSGVVLNDGTPVGLLYAGNRSGKIGIANNIIDVLTELGGLTIDGIP